MRVTIKLLIRMALSLLLISQVGMSYSQVLKIGSSASMGAIISNTNEALPSSYNFQEYVFPEPNDQGVCTDAKNETAIIDDIYLSQTHRLNLNNQLFFTVGYRPALFQVAITGSGKSPGVKILGFHDNKEIGKLCLKGPSDLASTVNTSVPDFENYFSVTIPKSWMRPDLSLELYVGDQQRNVSKEELKVGPYTEMNLVMFEMDVLNYNTAPHRNPIIKNFLQEVASAFPASVVRYGEFPARLKFPELIASNGTEKLVRLRGTGDKLSNNITSDGSINSVMKLFLTSLHRSTGDYLSTFYFGNTLNLAPGGWGGGKSFVSFDFDDVFVHELGHAFSLPHWGEAAWGISPTKYQYLYPYSGDAGYGTDNEAKGGGRGESWNFIQDIYEFINPICQFNARGKAGLETSDAMQRNNHCLGARSNSKGPWDGFGDFSALALHRYLVGAQEQAGQVWYKGGAQNFQLTEQSGFPVVSLKDGKRIYTRDPLQIGNGIPAPSQQERWAGLGAESHEREAYLIYGTTHPTQADANIVYEPVKFKGTIPPIVDPTNIKMIQELKTDNLYAELFSQPRDITLKMYYEDGSTLHAINSSSSFARQESYPDDSFNIWRYDLDNFSLVVPGDKKLLKVEVYHRPFHMSSWRSDEAGYINDRENPIEDGNFMSTALLKASFPPTKKNLAAGSIGNLVWYDLNKNGTADEGEPGIPGVSVYLWRDTDGDDIPDVGTNPAVAITDSNGNYRYTGLAPGPYRAFVWMIDNWAIGDPLFGMVSSKNGKLSPDNDIDNDNNACFRGSTVDPNKATCGAALKKRDISTGIINLTPSDEPLNDGDPKNDPFLDYDQSGNMTIDFGFHYESAQAFYLGGSLILPNVSAGESNYHVELKLMSLNPPKFELTALKTANDSYPILGSLLKNNLIDIPKLIIQGEYYRVGLLWDSAFTFSVAYANEVAD